MPYATRQNIEEIYGCSNVEKWADVNNSGDVTFLNKRITWALNLAERSVDSRLKECAYNVPFIDPIDPLITDMTARLAGVMLYESRGIVDADPDETSQLEIHKQKVDYMIRQVHAGRVKLSATVNAVNYAQSVPIS